MTEKLGASIFIISFWLMFPVILMFMGSTEFIQPETGAVDDIDESNILFQTIKVYFTILVLYIPNAPFWINTIVTIFKLVSVLTLYLLGRGD